MSWPGCEADIAEAPAPADAPAPLPQVSVDVAPPLTPVSVGVALPLAPIPIDVTPPLVCCAGCDGAPLTPATLSCCCPCAPASLPAESSCGLPALRPATSAMEAAALAFTTPEGGGAVASSSRSTRSIRSPLRRSNRCNNSSVACPSSFRPSSCESLRPWRKSPAMVSTSANTRLRNRSRSADFGAALTSWWRDLTCIARSSSFI
mmetsp:Transcript_129699/g.375648  ORF Transcript_129699/g.375648 Transcript_129699/m.375648 type:complete len:205 (-) Transcript_129699:263-877(-)